MAVARLDDDDLEAMVAALEAENERLRDEIEMLKMDWGARFIAPLQFKLTPKETLMFGRLLRGGLCSKNLLMAALYTAGADDDPEIKIVGVFICKMRKKIAPWGLRIDTIWGHGYQMSGAMIEKFKTDWGYGHEGPGPR